LQKYVLEKRKLLEEENSSNYVNSEQNINKLNNLHACNSLFMAVSNYSDLDGEVCKKDEVFKETV
jgi:hypothetical protein